jgi:hypothetical protein
MFSLAVAFALASAAEPPASQPAPSAERICRGGGQRTLGTHMRTRRRCLTAEQWAREDEAARNRPAPGLQVTEGQNDGRAPVQPH